MSDKAAQGATYYDGDECMRTIAQASHDRGLSFCIGTAIKYLWRAGRKDGESKSDDIGKARWYIAWAKENAAPGVDDRSLLYDMEYVSGLVLTGVRDAAEVQQMLRVIAARRGG